MLQQASPNAISDRLKRALAQNELPIEAQKRGYRLLNRLNSPVRVGLFSLAYQRSFALANALLGQQALLCDVQLPSLEFCYGSREKTTLVATENVISTLDGIQFPSAMPSEVNLIRIHLPCEILETMDLFVVSIDGSESDRHQVVKWAENRTDVALWCTEKFDSLEEHLWAQVGERLKNNSYLTIIDADDLFVSRQLDQRISILSRFVGAEFHGFFATAVKTALKSISEQGKVSDHIWQQTGLNSLSATLLKRIQSGKVADMDNTVMFLSGHGLSISSDINECVVPKPSDVQPIPVSQKEMLAKALAILQSGGADLQATLSFVGARASSEILEHCIALCDQLNELFLDVSAPNQAEIEFGELLWEASDMLTLMQLEGNGAAAADAVSMLLQLRRDIERKVSEKLNILVKMRA